MTAYLLLAAVAWALATRGGTAPRDLVVVLVLLGVAALVSRPIRRPDPAVVAATTACVGWLLVVGQSRVGLSLESVRVPVLVVLAALTVLVARRWQVEARETFLGGLIALGCLHAVIALADVGTAAAQGVSVPLRADSLLGSSNGLGTLLVASSVLTARQVGRRHGRWSVVALLLQGCAILATGSRSAIVVASVLLVGYAATRPDWRLRGLAVVGVTAGTAVLVWRFATEPPEQRPHLWQEALGRIAARPLTGEGPAPIPYATSVPGARVTTHAHNEILQWGVEYGLIGVGLGLLTLMLALRGRRLLRQGDRLVLVAAAVLLGAGMTDFTLRITAFTIVAAATMSLAATDDRLPDPGSPARSDEGDDARQRSR